jgi:hypothetical protein
LIVARPKKFATANTDEDFWAYVQPTGFCWLWVGTELNNGYGHFNIHYKQVAPHRKAYELLIGPIPEGLQLDHLCRVKLCVNPDHLEPVTGRENTLRSFGPSAVNARKTHCINGHEFTAANTLPRTRPSGGRHCRECAKLNARKRRAAKKYQG